MAGMNGSREWAAIIEQRYASGVDVPTYAVKQAADVLGRPLLRGGKRAQRPDSSDRRAGDDSFDEQVPI